MTFRRQKFHRWSGIVAAAVCAGCTSLPSVLPTKKLAAEQAEKTRVAAVATDAIPRNAQRKELTPDESAAVCMAAAREMEAHDRPAAAIEQYERARTFHAKTKGIARRLAVLFDRQGDHERAAAEYAAALKEEPHDADLWNDYAYFQYERTEYAAAEQSARKALKIDGAHKRAWVNLGLILAEQARYDDAFAAFTQAVSPAAAHNNLGIIQARQGRIDLARVELARAKQLEPTLRQPQAVLDFLAAAERGPHEPQDAEPVSSRRTKP